MPIIYGAHECLLQVTNATLELLVDNLPRLNEQEEADRQGVFHVLGMLPSGGFFVNAYNKPRDIRKYAWS